MAGSQIVAIWFGRCWSKDDLEMLADTLEVGIEARASRNRHTGDLTSVQEDALKNTISNIRIQYLLKE
jgi:hypothetical protein